jgi:nitrate/TMAO reductase-like tetraheme cytochrome c subunit
VSRGSRRRFRDRAARFASWACIVTLFGSAALSVGLTAAVHHTAQPEFCNSCHIMEPYFESWQHSAHHGVACIECHYEPGTLETVAGKFQAINQLVKYFTRTAGTKPWAEVSDASCMRSGCHSVRTLDGPVEFGAVSFDHRPHLLESRQGRRLRCVTCHSQDVQGEHIAVTSPVCFACHFKPSADLALPGKTDECTICHRSQLPDAVVAGTAFRHEEFVDRGVACRECHDPVVQGDGTVREERCRSCHAQTGQLDRIGETAFLHEEHVTKNKVECTDCHDEIHHGLLPLDPIRPSPKEGCGTCHESSHDAARQLYAGTGAVGVPDDPSRMFETRVVCAACHTGRASRAVNAAARAHGAVSVVASAGNVDCIHCHGTSYDGMLSEWQAAVGEQLDRLGPLLREVEGRLGDGASPEAAAAVGEARRDFLLVSLDGSRGAHNVSYALDALAACAARIDGARGILGVADESSASSGFPFRSADGCSKCHAALGRPAAISRAEKVFPHQRHLASGLDCSACHSVLEHGRPAFPRDQCATCHHQEAPGRDVEDCASCHAAQEQMLRGTLAGPEPWAGPMSSMECSECHGEAPDVLRPAPQACVLCHQAGYDEKFLRWAGEIERLQAELERVLAAPPAATAEPEAAARARAALEAVTRDGSRGAHHYELARSLLEGALRDLGAR